MRKLPAKIKRDRVFDLSSALYTQWGNDFRNWTGSASNLFAGAMILRQEHEKEYRRIRNTPPGQAGPISVAIGTFDAERLLTGFALEALLKAAWLKAGHTLVGDGKYLGLPCERKKKKWHNLVAICDDVGICLTDSERHILKALSDVVRYKSRYPIAIRWEHMEPVFYWHEEWDTTIGQLVTRLWQLLGYSAQKVPIGGSALPTNKKRS